MKYYFALFLVVLFLSCQKEPCSDSIDFGSFELSTEALSYYPYTAVNNRLIFVDSSGEETTFLLQNNFLQSSENLIPGPCPEDSSQTVNYVSESEFYRLNLVGLELGIEFQIRISDVPQPNDMGISGEELIIISVDNGNRAGCLFQRIEQKDQSGAAISPRDNTILLDSLQLINKTYTEILLNNELGVYPNPPFQVYYNQAFGLVGFENRTTGVVYELDRIEN